MAATPLQQIIIERIQKEGPLTFAEYMRMALYEPHYGYYITEPTKIGWEGDYYTSTDISAFFANCMGRQLYQWWQKLGQPERFNVLEQGAGGGKLAQGIAAWAKQAAPAFHAVLDYRLEDIKQGQDAIMSSANQAVTSWESCDRKGYAFLPERDTCPPDRVPQHFTQHVNSDSPPVPSVILSNELIDAFPVHIVEARDKRLYEVYVDVQGERLREVLDEPSSPEVASYLDDYNIPWVSFGDGWRAEINLEALHWMRQTAQILQRGFILTIDYGDKARALYTQNRRRGTLACYFHHQMNERPLARPGEQDITAHVNFSALINEGRLQGLRLNKFTTQRSWLASLGIYEDLEQRCLHEFPEADTERATDRGQVALLKRRILHQQVAALTDATGMGNFKVLILRR